LIGFNKPVSISFYDITGRLVHQLIMDAEETVVRTNEILLPGLYLVKANDYSKTISRKIVVR